MKKIVLVPDSFKGTMSSVEICQILKDSFLRHHSKLSVISIPVADGGEGTVDALLTALGGKRIDLCCTGPRQEPVNAFYGMLPDGVAVVEMAAAAGLPLMGERLDPMNSTTYGVGQLLLAAAKEGACRIILGLGGSATNDGGVGAAAAVGVRFFDERGVEYLPTGSTLNRLSRIDCSQIDPVLKGVEIFTICDIDNPLCGPQGAAAVFGPQKGADANMIATLDKNLAHMAAVIREQLGTDIGQMPGAGAAGGMGGGMAAFFGSRLQPGISAVLDAVKFDELLQDADLVITGEGKLDSQSLRGKVVCGVGARAAAAGVPVLAIVGDIGAGAEGAYDLGITGIFSINRVAVPFSEAKHRCKEDLAATADNLARVLARFGV